VRKETFYLLVLIIVVTIGAFLFYILGKSSLGEKEEEAKRVLAECLQKKGILMYGLDTCPHSSRQKKEFGKSFSLISYIECRKEKEKCKEEGISAVPTWSFPKEVGVEKKILSCEECRKKQKSIYCNDYCFILSPKGKVLISGAMPLEKLAEISGCPYPKKK